jgi:hypothetical protein
MYKGWAIKTSPYSHCQYETKCKVVLQFGVRLHLTPKCILYNFSYVTDLMLIHCRYKTNVAILTTLYL